MDPMQLSASMNPDHYTYKHEVAIGSETILVRSAILRSEREELALALASGTLVFDEENGVVYEGYNKDIVETIHIIGRYTDVDITKFDTPEGRYELYDILESTGAMERIHRIIEDDLCKVHEIYYAIKNGAQRSFERSHSLSHQIKQVFTSLLGSDDIASTFAKAQEVNASLIDMLGAVRREKAAKPASNLIQYAKRES